MGKAWDKSKSRVKFLLEENKNNGLSCNLCNSPYSEIYDFMLFLSLSYFMR